MVDECDGGLLVVTWVGAQHAKSGAVVNGGVLVAPLLAAGLAQWFDEPHVELQLVAGR